MKKTRNTTWQNEQNKKYNIIKWTKQEIPNNKKNKTNISCFVHCVIWYFLFCSLCHVVFLVLSILLYGISCFVHCVIWYFLFCPFYHVVFLVLNEQNKKYHMIKWTKQEIPYNKMDKTRNTIWHNEQSKKYHIIKWSKQEIPDNKMDKTRDITWHNEQNKRYHMTKWTKQEILHDTMNKTRNTK
jgi:hypothetical protein